jgi:hypothetical protein
MVEKIHILYSAPAFSIFIEGEYFLSNLRQKNVQNQFYLQFYFSFLTKNSLSKLFCKFVRPQMYYKRSASSQHACKTQLSIEYLMPTAGPKFSLFYARTPKSIDLGVLVLCNLLNAAGTVLEGRPLRPPRPPRPLESNC